MVQIAHHVGLLDERRESASGSSPGRQGLVPTSSLASIPFDSSKYQMLDVLEQCRRQYESRYRLQRKQIPQRPEVERH